MEMVVRTKGAKGANKERRDYLSPLHFNKYTCWNPLSGVRDANREFEVAYFFRSTC